MKLPNTIKEIDLGTPPDSYEGYLYKFTNLKNNKVYVGVHKGQVDDGYWNSATDEEFQEEFRNDGEFKYEIIEYGNYDTMTAREYEILKRAELPNNLFYNKSAGSPKYRTPRIELVEEIKERIRNGEFDTKKESIESVLEITRLQVRSEDMSKHQSEISQKVDDDGGNTDGYTCTVLENRIKSKDVDTPQYLRDLRIDGNHSVYGIDKSKHGKDINVVRVPEEVHKNLNDSEIKLLANLLNGRPDRPTVAVDEDDAIKQLINQFNELGTPVDDKSNHLLLQSMGFTKKKSSAIIEKAKKEQDILVNKMVGKIWINWNASPFDKRLETMMEDHKDANTMVLTVSSGMVHVSRIMQEIYDANTGREQLNQKPKKEVIIFVKHPSKKYHDKWKLGGELKDTKFLKYWIEPLGMDIRFIDLPMYESEIN